MLILTSIIFSDLHGPVLSINIMEDYLTPTEERNFKTFLQLLEYSFKVCKPEYFDQLPYRY